MAHSSSCDIAVIGAGAAGLAAAIFAAEAGRAAGRALRIVLLDGAKTIGAKILVSGGARCNVTNDHVTPADYNAPGGSHFVRHVLSAFDEKDTVKWFASLGVELKREETGKLFPVTDSSRTVLEALLRRCEELKIDIRTQHRVRRVHAYDLVNQRQFRSRWIHGYIPDDEDVDADGPEESEAPSAFDLKEWAEQNWKSKQLIPHRSPSPLGVLFEVECDFAARRADHRTLRADRLIMATGGKSLPLTGSDGHGWQIAEWLGHTITPTFPALVPLLLDSSFFHTSLSGLAIEAELSIFASGKRIDHRTGSLLWTHWGISGPVVMDASRHFFVGKSRDGSTQMKLSLLPGKDFEAVEKRLIDLAARQPKRMLITALTELLPQRLCEALLRHLTIDASLPLGQLARESRRSIVHALTALPLPILRDRGWNYAEVTAGGVPLSEVHHRDLQSRLVPGLHLIGEMLDCDGRIGGFNFQWAWSTGYIAGRAAAR